MDRLRAQEPGFAVRYLEKMMNATAAEQQAAIDQFGQEPLPTILSIEGSEAKISISGPLSPVGPSPLARFFGYGGTGYADIIAAVKEVKSNPAITKVTFPANTPGGLLTMLDETRQEIAELAQVKEVVFENHGMIASAGMWLAAVPGAKIIATSPTVETGSIGVKMVGYDASEALKSMGYKKVVILSQNAPNKAASLDTKTGIAENQRQADALERIFISRVAEGRGVSEQTVIDDFGHGGLLVAQDPSPDSPDALSVGMIDALVEGTGVMESESESDAEAQVQSHSGQHSTEGQQQKGGQGSASPTIQESKSMTLKELLAANPGAQAEHDAAIAAAQVQGEESGKKAVNARIEAAKPFLSSESKYPAAIANLATKVVSGEVDSSALVAAVAAFDATAESAASAEAEAEDKEKGDTSAQDHPQGSASGEIKTNEDYEANVAAARKARGLEG